MLQKIKSSFILKKVFINIDIMRKLTSIIYNKKIQKNLGITIVDYRRYSGKYKKEENGKIEVYNSYNNELLFKGNYLNGKRNGLVREYNEKDQLVFQGEYLDGKKWKGLEYIYDDITDTKILELEYLNGIIDGIGKEYDRYNGHLLFSGKYLNGKRNGEGEEYKYIPFVKSGYSNTYIEYKLIKIFSGEYLNGERKEGKEFNCKEELIYEGEYLNGKRNGKGKIYDENGELIYKGEILKGMKNGKGEEYNIYYKIKYEGEFLNGKKHGKGKEYKDDDGNKLLIFEGEYFKNFRVRGKEYYENGKLKFEGEYKNIFE